MEGHFAQSMNQEDVETGKSPNTAHNRSDHHKSFLKSSFELIQVVVGIYATFMAMSSYQEQITRRPYGDSYFNFPLFLVFLQCVLNYITAFGKLRLYPSERGRKSVVPRYYYIGASLAYVIASSSSNAALIYVNYPTQVLAKSCKMIPVMIMGMLVAKKQYSFSRIVAVLMTTVGISVFMIDRFGHKHKEDSENENNTYGLLLLIVSLAADGFTNSIQDLMRTLEHKPTSDDLMLNMNLYASIFVGIAMFYTGQFFPAVEFCMNHPEIIQHIAIFCITMALGQIFIFWCIASFGTLELSIITTTRKFFTILWSVFTFGHHMSGVQWSGVLIVFIGLMYDIFVSYQKHKEHKKTG